MWIVCIRKCTHEYMHMKKCMRFEKHVLVCVSCAYTEGLHIYMLIHSYNLTSGYTFNNCYILTSPHIPSYYTYVNI